jgi:DNA-directed RNA polymerase specialized sigma subunit
MVYKEAQSMIVELLERMGETCKQILTLFYYDDLSMKEILKQVNYENEQVLRNKKYKCLKELTSTIQQSPILFDNVKSALQRLK